MANLLTYPVLSPIEHDQKCFEPGETIDLDDQAAAALIAAGAIGNEPASGSPVKPKTATELIALIKEAATIEDLEALVGDDTRTTVVAAVAARKKELGG